MKYRNMLIDDYDKVYALWLGTKGMGLNDVDDSREGIERYLRRNPSACFVCEDNDEIVGVILCGNDGRRGYIHHTAVKENRRRQGIGGELVRHAMEALGKEKISKCALVVFERNDIGNGFWEAKGFKERDDLVYRNMALKELKRIDT